jgi:hypothetical protein
MLKFILILISTFPLSNVNADEAVFNSAFGVKFGQPYDKVKYTGNRIFINPRKKTKGCPVIHYWGEFCCFCS